MALIKCPECGAQVSDRASACPHCGCPCGSGSNGVIKLKFSQNTVFASATFHVDVTFDGETKHLNYKGAKAEFVVPNDGKTRTLKMHLAYGIHVDDYSFEIKSGETKWYSIEYYKGAFMGSWRVHDRTDDVRLYW